MTDGPGGEPGALDTSLLFDVFALNQAIARLLGEAMRDAPLTSGEYAIYSAIFELEATSPTRIAARLGMRLTTFMDHLRSIEGRRHARRVPHPTDRRSYRVVLTTDGLAAHRASNRAFEAGYRAFEDALGDGHVDGEGGASARAVLRRLREAADRAARAGAATPPSGGRGG